MRGELVAIDLETTGLDPLQDAIIEVGAVRLRDGEIIEEYTTLVDPDRPIPTLITSITGLRAEDLYGAPRIAAVLPAIRAFVGNASVIGHNVAFDTAFLYKQGILQTNSRIDTYDLASVMLPRAPRYSLSNLTSQMTIELEHAHRALHDARATALLYWMLWQKILELPMSTLYEINLAAKDLAWDSRIVFDAALLERMGHGEVLTDPDLNIARLFDQLPEGVTPLQPVVPPVDVALPDVIRLIDTDGALAQHLPGYEYRPQQLDMTSAIVDAFNNAQHALIEAGTGTGKSIAYLVPAIQWAVQNNERVVISTNTINLQEQLMLKDIPAVGEALGIPFRAALLKGRGNYLCPRRLTAVRRRRPTSVDELRTMAKILVWLLESSSGDRGEINLRGPSENATWQRMSAEDEDCTLDRCAMAMEGRCPFYKARKAAEAAHLVIVNHALLISDAVADNQVLPDYKYLVVDEAHHLEDATTSGLSQRLDEATLRRRLADLGGPHRGLLGSILRSAQGKATEKEVLRLTKFVEMIHDATSVMEVHIGSLFSAIRAFSRDVLGERALDYTTQVRVTPQQRQRVSFSAIASAWGTLSEFFEAISGAMGMLASALGRLESYQLPDFSDLLSSTTTAARYLNDMNQMLRSFALEPDDNTIYWIHLTQDGEYLSLNTAPLHVGPLVDKYLWSTKRSIIMTSATLQTNRSFDFIRDRLNAEFIETKELGSPFNYRESTLLYIPTDIPDPNERIRYQQAVERGIIDLAAGLNGRVLVLFTSYSQLRETSQAITPRLALGNITVYDQSDGTNRQALLDGFKSTERAVLLGTRSFWEGVDIPGESLSALVIVRLPFAVPSEPVFAARSETYSNSFAEYGLPDAILRFRQGFGRLIRTKTDRGIVTIFDSRIVNKGYGVNFIEALPDCTVQYGSLNSLTDAAKAWLDGRKV